MDHVNGIDTYSLDLREVKQSVLARAQHFGAKAVKSIFGADVTDVEAAIKELDRKFAAATNAASPEFKTKLRELKTIAAEKQQLFNAASNVNEALNVRVPKENGREAYDAAHSALKEARGNVHQLLTGSGDVKDEKVKDAYNLLHEKLSSAKKLFESPLGMLRTDGFAKTVGHNMKGFAFWDKEARAAVKGHEGALAMRGVTVAAGVATMVHSVLPDRNRAENEDGRSATGRIFQFIVGGGVTLAGTTFARAL